ncbi:MAG: hypothetical protein O7C59_07675 [Rickettsia endosymbiont of Ixodes persulcatus]|nr:hypothetical protein [Rickettsia endosymbiont of Ixodes persulcatus]MCZ6903571.1 hypothetical protein [Rickettsia endosymbiont of Ixodes persulcatus]MCZ6908488.1 hypothetical protein [Rickettsia endosymbiont of Ixodes persulcatus]MCZ6909879.1 hypothetical protein [Rickettsia endosymbiont of Ixodes persulcatus]MCZ6914321.1 hypothetical protein [Rickettsia endosymbiont of Ixodes persulcatus]
MKTKELSNTNIINKKINNDNQAVLSPMPDVGGIFSKYKKNNELSFEEIRDKAWRENLEELLGESINKYRTTTTVVISKRIRKVS